MNAQDTDAQESAQTAADTADRLTADALIEEVSIDGMCGVY